MYLRRFCTDHRYLVYIRIYQHLLEDLYKLKRSEFLCTTTKNNHDYRSSQVVQNSVCDGIASKRCKLFGALIMFHGIVITSMYTVNATMTNMLANSKEKSQNFYSLSARKYNNHYCNIAAQHNNNSLRGELKPAS